MGSEQIMTTLNNKMHTLSALLPSPGSGSTQLARSEAYKYKIRDQNTLFSLWTKETHTTKKVTKVNHITK